MYAKLFSSLYQGTLRGRSNAILVFTNLLAHTGKDGTVDKHYRAIADETGLPLDTVMAALLELESPDPESRSPDEGGARIVRLDEHRAWGWRVVNHGKYRSIKSEDDRAEQNRLAQARWREKNKQSKQGVSNTKQDKPIQRQRQRQRQKENAEEEPKQPPAPPSLSARGLELCSWFNRRSTTAWSTKELKAAAIIKSVDDEDWQALRWYYTQSGCQFLRRDILTLLNNLTGEIDRAKNYTPPTR